MANKFDFVDIGCDRGGYYVEWYRETNMNDTMYVARWYGSREACTARATLPAPPLKLVRIW